MVLHGLIHIHGGQRRHIEARQPHIHHDGYLHLVALILELLGKFLLVGFAAYNVCPFLWVLIAAGHHHLHLLSPPGAQFKDALVYLHRYRSRVCHYHSLTAADVLAAVLVVSDDVCYEVINRRIITQQRIHVRHFLLVLFQVGFRYAFLSQPFILSINLGKHFIVEFQFDYTAFIIDRSCSPIVDSLRHVIHINVVTKDFASVPVLV